MSKQFNKKPSNEPEHSTPPNVSPETSSEAETDVPVMITTSDARNLSTTIAEKVRLSTDTDLNEALKGLRHELRRRDSEREALRPKAGSKVRILKGRPKYVGKVGTAVIVRRSRCFVTVPEVSSPAYVLISDLELVER